MKNETIYNDCEKCIWKDICTFGQPCNYYTPEDIDEAISRAAERRRRNLFRADWDEYIEYCSDENVFF